MNYVANGYVRSGYIREDSDTVGSYTFDKYGKKIFVSEAVSNIDLVDMWSRFVDWYVVDENTKIKPAMKYSGFDVIPTGFTGATFFMYNGWKCVYNPNTTAVSGVLYSEDYTTGYWDIDDNPIYPVTVSAVVNTVSVGSGLSVAQNEKLMSLLNADFTATDLAIASVKSDTENIIDDVAEISAGSGATAQEVWEYTSRELTSAPAGGLDEDEIHAALDNYTNKNDWKASDVDMTETNALITSSKDEVIVAVEEGEANIRNAVEDIQNGNWEVVNNQMIMKSVAGEEIARFNLFDAAGNPTMRAVHKRERV